MFLEPSVMFINSCNVHIHLYTKVGAMYISMTVCIRETKQNTHTLVHVPTTQCLTMKHKHTTFETHSGAPENTQNRSKLKKTVFTNFSSIYFTTMSDSPRTT